METVQGCWQGLCMCENQFVLCGSTCEKTSLQQFRSPKYLNPEFVPLLSFHRTKQGLTIFEALDPSASAVVTWSKYIEGVAIIHHLDTNTKKNLSANAVIVTRSTLNA